MYSVHSTQHLKCTMTMLPIFGDNSATAEFQKYEDVKRHLV